MPAWPQYLLLMAQPADRPSIHATREELPFARVRSAREDDLARG
jgi:hypothetical protein